MQSVGDARRFWWRGTSPPAAPSLTLSIDPGDFDRSPVPHRSDCAVATDRPDRADTSPPLVWPDQLYQSDPLPAVVSPSAATARSNRRALSRVGRSRAPLVAMFVGAGIFILVSLGGTRLSPSGSLSSEIDRIAASSGLAIRDISISGHVNTLDHEVFAALDGQRARSLIGFDSRAARDAIERLAWVRAARITRVWPDRIVVDIEERRAAAVWQDGRREVLIDRTGHHLATVATGRAAGLPVLRGAGAPDAAGPLLDALAARPELAARVGLADRIGDRRWTLVFKGGGLVHLPAGDRHAVAQAIERLVAGADGQRPIDTKFAVLDLRLADRMIIASEPSARRADAQLRASNGRVASRQGGANVE